jgi:hypothetical protein
MSAMGSLRLCGKKRCQISVELGFGHSTPDGNCKISYESERFRRKKTVISHQCEITAIIALRRIVMLLHVARCITQCAYQIRYLTDFQQDS